MPMSIKDTTAIGNYCKTIRMKGKYAANRIREIRLRAGQTMENVALALNDDTTMSTIAKLETGRMALSLDWIRRIARVLRVSPHELIAEEDRFGMVPVLSGDDVLQPQHDSIEPKSFMPIPSDAGAKFAMPVETDEFSQVVGKGGVIVVDPEAAGLEDGRYFLLTIANRPAIRRFHASPPRLAACSVDGDSTPTLVGAEPFAVIGRVVGGWTAPL